MKEPLPSPLFDSNRYERPQQNWICGHAAQGKPCRVGPDRKGRCRATFECQPFLELKPGETKGRYRCTRSAQFGGPCNLGPLPNGVCSCRISKCNPVRSLRAKRGVLTACLVAFSVAALAIMLSGPFRAKFINPGPLSAQPPSAIETGLLRIVLLHEDLVDWAASHLDPDWIQHPLTRKIIELRFSARQNESWLGLAGFIAECEDVDAQTLITSLAAEQRDLPNPAQQLADIVIRLRNQSVDRQLAASIQKINQPETTESERLELLRQQQELRALKRQPLTPRSS